MMKILTLVIPAYNSEKFLDKCVTSMLHPAIQNELEILIINDGSTDRTKEIAESYCRRYPDTVRLITQENKGHGGALNTGCAAASGKYLKVIDADDWVNTEQLPIFLQTLSACKSDVVLTPYHTVNVSTGEVRSWQCDTSRVGDTVTFSEIMQDWHAFEQGLTFHGITYRTNFYHEKAQPLPEHVFYEDHTFATFPCCEAGTITATNYLIYEYRIGDCNQSVARGNQHRRHADMEAVLKDMELRYHKMTATPNREYVAKKLGVVLLSYFVTTLLADRDRKEGRFLAEAQFRQCAELAPEAAASVKKKYGIFYLMNRFHRTDATWDRILHSSLYQHLMRK